MNSFGSFTRWPVHRLLFALLLTGPAFGGLLASTVMQPPAWAATDDAPLAVDWSTRDEVFELDNGWTVSGCEGGAPLLCVTDGNRTVGIVELSEFPQDGAPLTEADLVARVNDFYGSIAEDRRATCGPEHRFTPDPVAPFTVGGGGPGVRYGFTAVDASGQLAERTVGYMRATADRLWVISAGAYNPGTCPGPDPELSDFAVADLVAFEPVLDEIATNSRLPAAGDGGCPAAPDADTPFTDIVGNAHRADILCAASHGLFHGVNGDTFAPARTLTRGQAASMLARLIEAAGGTLPAASPEPFSDIAGSVHAERIRQLAAAEVLRGRPDSTFRPAAPLNRAQAAALLVRTYEFVTGTALPPPGDPFPDAAGVHETAIGQAAELGLVRGVSPERYEPRGHVRRDQAAAFAVRLLEATSHAGPGTQE